MLRLISDCARRSVNQIWPIARRRRHEDAFEMPITATARFPTPRDDQEFEDIARDALRLHWRDRNAQRFGRSGQKQQGVDVLGHCPAAGGIVVAQCKNVLHPTLKMVEDAVAEISGFPGAVREFVFATSGSRAARLQEEVLLRFPRGTSQFAVVLMFWEDIVNGISADPELVTKYFATFVDIGRAALNDQCVLSDHARRMKLLVQLELLRPREDYWDGMTRSDLFLLDRVTIHDVERSTYPHLQDDEVGPSSWFKVDLYDIHETGIEVAMSTGVFGKVLPGGAWDIVMMKFRDADTKLLGLTGLIPFEVIHKINAKSCPYGDQPHIYCDFRYGQSPYEQMNVLDSAYGARLDNRLRRRLYPPEHRLDLRLG